MNRRPHTLRHLVFSLVFCLSLSLSLSLSLALALPASAASEASEASEGTYGEELTLDEVTPIAAILDAPEDFEGQTVRVEGKVRGVCAKAGCWMELADADGHEIRIKVEDGVIVFPQDAVDANATAEGTVKLYDMSREEYVGWRRHLAEEMGEDFDESSIGDGPYRLVQIAGSGARVGG